MRVMSISGHGGVVSVSGHGGMVLVDTGEWSGEYQWIWESGKYR